MEGESQVFHLTAFFFCFDQEKLSLKWKYLYLLNEICIYYTDP